MKKMLLLLLISVTPFSAVYAQRDLAKYQKRSKGFWLVEKSAIPSYIKVVPSNTKPEPVIVTTTPTAKRGIFNLSPEGQKAFIETLGSNQADNKVLLEDLSKPLENANTEASPIEIKKADFTSRFDFKVDNFTGRRENRIDELEIWVKLENNDDVEFAAFNNFSSKYKTLDFGTLAVSRVTGFTANAGINLAGTGSTSSTTNDGGKTIKSTGENEQNYTSIESTNGSGNTSGSTNSTTSNLGVGYSNSKTVSQQIAIKSDVVTMKGSLTSNEFSVYQKGVPNQDLVDNLNVSIICKAKKTKTESYFVVKGLFDPRTNLAVTDITKISITPGYIACPQIENDVYATVSFAFIFRSVIRGGNTIKESDDVVQFPYSDSKTDTEQRVKVFSKDDLKTKLIRIENGTGKIMYMKYYNKYMPLYFADEVPALQFIEWLRQTNSVTLKAFPLYFSGDNGRTYDNYASDMSVNCEVKKIGM